MFTRGVLNGKAKAKYRGLVDIKKGAYKSSGYQK
jgi:Fe-S cluster assembly scaffold protein SufB